MHVRVTRLFFSIAVTEYFVAGWILISHEVDVIRFAKVRTQPVEPLGDAILTQYIAPHSFSWNFPSGDKKNPDIPQGMIFCCEYPAIVSQLIAATNQNA